MWGLPEHTIQWYDPQTIKRQPKPVNCHPILGAVKYHSNSSVYFYPGFKCEDSAKTYLWLRRSEICGP